MRWDALGALILFDMRRAGRALTQTVVAFSAVLIVILARQWQNPIMWMALPLMIVSLSVFFVPGVAIQDRSSGTTAYVSTLPFSGTELAGARTIVLCSTILAGASLAVVLTTVIVRVGHLSWPVSLLLGLPPICVAVFLPVAMLLTLLHASAPVMVSLASFGVISATLYTLWRRVAQLAGANWLALIPMTTGTAIAAAVGVWLAWALCVFILFRLIAHVLQPAAAPTEDAIRYLDAPNHRLLPTNANISPVRLVTSV
ncbi:MAG: hypothetical protein ABI852_06570 [Gemmatimonadaceae bacterium]